MRFCCRRQAVIVVGALFVAAVLDFGLFGDGASADDRQIQHAIDHGVDYLRKTAVSQVAGFNSLVALAMLKAGEPPDAPSVAQIVDLILKKIDQDNYNPGGHHYYTAGVDLMVLEAVDPEQYRPQMEAVTRYIIRGQFSHGCWYYPTGVTDQGDTSISQYAMLGLWTSSRVGIDVPLDVWSRAAAWHVRTQRPDGGFSYHPDAGKGGSSRHTMTVAGTGSLHIAKMHLYAEKSLPRQQRQQKQKTSDRPNKFRFLEPIDLDTPEDSRKPKPSRRPSVAKAKIPLAPIDKAIFGGLGWLAKNWSIEGGELIRGRSHVNYFLYGLERAAALADVELIGDHNWYSEGAAHLLQTQAENGSWSSSSGPAAGTSFGLLFLTRATAKLLNRPIRSIGVGSGLLAGGRGLPDNLLQIQVTGGKVKTRKSLGLFDELLAELENPQSLKIESTQQAILEKVQLGNRKALIGQKMRLVRLVKDPRPEVRRIALWALSRSDDLRLAPLMIAALDDPNLDVMVEARNALCTLSRRPRGFGKPDHPLHGLPEDATESQQKAARKSWRSQVVAKWQEWYLTVRAYDERDDFSDNKQK